MGNSFAFPKENVHTELNLCTEKALKNHEFETNNQSTVCAGKSNPAKFKANARSDSDFDFGICMKSLSCCKDRAFIEGKAKSGRQLFSAAKFQDSENRCQVRDTKTISTPPSLASRFPVQPIDSVKASPESAFAKPVAGYRRRRSSAFSGDLPPGWDLQELEQLQAAVQQVALELQTRRPSFREMQALVAARGLGTKVHPDAQSAHRTR